jgi:hypothetical protein
MADDPVGTLTDEVEEVEEKLDSSDEGVGDSGEGTQDDFFLDVDERHRYKTKEDVVKAIKESGARIGSLSAWDKEIGQAFNITPAEAAELLDELADRRNREKIAAETKNSPEKVPTRSEKTDITDPEELKRHKANLAYLKENGFLTKAEVDEVLKELRAEVKSLKGESEASIQERFKSRVDQGESYIASLVKGAQLPDTITKTAAKFITGCLSEGNDPDGKLFRKFMAGGEPMKELLKSLFDEFNDGLAPVRASAKGAYQTDKEKSAGAGAKNLPRGGAGSEPPTKKPAPKKEFTGRTDPALHDRAWDIMQRVAKESA